jgi:outer membrane autotransporter protein
MIYSLRSARQDFLGGTALTKASLSSSVLRAALITGSLALTAIWQPASAQAVIDLGLSVSLPDQAYPNPWTPASLNVGILGQGTLTIGSGVQVVTSQDSVLGRTNTGNGLVTVSGANASWVIGNPTARMTIGDEGSGTLRIENGGLVSGGAILLGNAAGAQGTAVVTGPGSRWVSEAIAVGGVDGTGSLKIDAGGQVNVGLFYISGGAGTAVEVQGAGSKLSVSEEFIVGNSVTEEEGSLTVTDGGTAEVRTGTGRLLVAQGRGSTGILNIGAPVGAPAGSPGTISAGEVRFGSGAGIINFNHTDSNYSFAPAMTGNGSVNALSGTTLLTGPNTYTGGTIIAGGTLRAGSSSALPANTSYTINKGTLDLNDYGLVMGRFSGSGGVLDLGSASVVVDQAASSTFSGAINGTGTLTKKDNGTLTLSGTGDLSGALLVQGGSLVVNGSLASSDVQVTGGSLGGSGSVGGIIVESGGTVAPGTTSISTLNASRDVSFEAGSIFEVNVSPVSSDLLRANGRASLSGGRVKVLAESGSYQPSTTYTILTAAGGLMNTTFAGVSSNFAYLDPSLFYTPNDVVLTLTRKTVPTDPTDPVDPSDPPTDPVDPIDPPVEPNEPPPLAFNSVAVSVNQYRVADAVEALGSGNHVFDVVIGQSVAGARQAFDALSGEAHASAMTVVDEESRLVREAILTRLRQPLGSSLPAFVQGSYSAAYAADLPGRVPKPVPVSPGVDPRRFALWGEGFGSWGKVDGNAASLDTATGGFILGADALVSEAIRLGVAGGFTRTTFDEDGRLSSGSNDSVFGALYGSFSWGALCLRLGASYARHDFDVQRRVQFPGFADSTQASYDGSTAQAFAEVGYGFDLGRVFLEPFVGASVLRLHTDAFQEEGGAATLTGYARDQDLATTTLGLRAEARLSQDLPLTLRGLLGWRHAYGDVEPQALLAFAGGASAFMVVGVPIDRDALVAEAGLDWQASDALSLGVSYSGQIGERAQDHALKGNLTWRFGSY